MSVQRKITKSDVEDYVRDDPYHVVVVYANWCGHCRQMIQKLGDKFQNYDILTFLEESQVDQDLLDYFPHVRVYQYGQADEGSVKDVYDLLQVE